MRALLSLLFLLAVASGPSVAAPCAPPRDPGLADRMERRLPALMDRFGVPGLAAAVLREGAVVWSGTFGDAARGIPVTGRTVFRLESISKSVTAWGVMRLAGTGRLALDDPAIRHTGAWRFPPSPHPAARITLRQLLSHTSGLPLGDLSARYPPGAGVPGLRAHLTREAVAVAPPGAGFAYSNTGYHVLQLVVEEVTGRPFADAMARDVLAPLGMEDAGFSRRDIPRDRLATGHDLSGAPVAPYVYPAQSSGGLHGTLADVARFAMAGMAPPFDCGTPNLDAGRIAALHGPETPTAGIYALVSGGYALGHFTDRLADGRLSVWHGGQGTGWMTHLQIVPETGDGIVLLSNSQRAWPLFAHALADWSDDIGTRGVGMAGLVPVIRGLTAALVLVLALAVLLLGQTAADLARGPGVPRRRRRGAGRAGIAAGLLMLGGVAWAGAQEYLVLFSVVPHLTGWITAAALLLPAALILRGVALSRRRRG